MTGFYAITRRNGRWVYVCSGVEPEQVYRDAVNLIEEQESDDEGVTISPATEAQLNSLRIVSEHAAREIYSLDPGAVNRRR